MKKYAFIQRLFRAESELACFNEVRDARGAAADHWRLAVRRSLRFPRGARSLCGQQPRLRCGVRASGWLQFGWRRARWQRRSGGRFGASRRRGRREWRWSCGRTDGRVRDRVCRCRHVPGRRLRDRLQHARHVHQSGEVPGWRRLPSRVWRTVRVLERHRLHASVALRHPMHGHVELSERRAVRR